MDSLLPANKALKKSRSLENEIDVMRDKLKKLEEQHKLQVQKERDRNFKLVVELIKSEKLDLLSVDHWRLAMPELKKSLNSQCASPAQNC